MSKIVKRGYVPSDEQEFSQDALDVLQKAGQDLYYLINHGYPIKSASVFVGNHYLLSERQRLALVRAISPKVQIERRKEKEITQIEPGSTLYVDGFNTIITLEIMLSNSLLLQCMDGTIRDLAGLRGTYRLIDKTDAAILLIGELLKEKKVGTVVFYLDAPVSNSGKLKQRMVELLSEYNFDAQVETIAQVDSVLASLDHVVTGDAIILDQCKSWFNMTKTIQIEKFPKFELVDFCRWKEFPSLIS